MYLGQSLLTLLLKKNQRKKVQRKTRRRRRRRKRGRKRKRKATKNLRKRKRKKKKSRRFQSLYLRRQSYSHSSGLLLSGLCLHHHRQPLRLFSLYLRSVGM